MDNDWLIDAINKCMDDNMFDIQEIYACDEYLEVLGDIFPTYAVERWRFYPDGTKEKIENI